LYAICAGELAVTAFFALCYLGVEVVFCPLMTPTNATTILWRSARCSGFNGFRDGLMGYRLLDAAGALAALCRCAHYRAGSGRAGLGPAPALKITSAPLATKVRARHAGGLIKPKTGSSFRISTMWVPGVALSRKKWRTNCNIDAYRPNHGNDQQHRAKAARQPRNAFRPGVTNKRPPQGFSPVAVSVRPDGQRQNLTDIMQEPRVQPDLPVPVPDRIACSSRFST